jgi:hypothetical protein
MQKSINQKYMTIEYRILVGKLALFAVVANIDKNQTLTPAV